MESRVFNRYDFTGNTIEIRTTDSYEANTFVVHKRLLCQTSDYFKTSREGHIYLPMGRDHIITYLSWLYRDKVVLREQPTRWGQEPVEPDSDDETDGNLTQITRAAIGCFLLGTKMKDRCFRNAVVAAFHQYLLRKDRYLNIDSIGSMWRWLEQRSPMAMLIRDYFALACSSAEIEKTYRLGPDDFNFVMETAWAQAEHRTKSSDDGTDPFGLEPYLEYEEESPSGSEGSGSVEELPRSWEPGTRAMGLSPVEEDEEIDDIE